MDKELENMLKKYDNPQEAETIWKEYLPEINGYGCYVSAFDILSRTRSANWLDIKLDKLISRSGRRK